MDPKSQRAGGSGPIKLISTKFIRKLLFDDWALKLTALGITLTLWLGVTGLSTPTTKRLTVPINFSIPNNTEITNSPVQEIDVVLSGDKRRIDQINRTDLVASIDLTDIQPGDRAVSLTPDNVSVTLPPGIKLNEVQPSRIVIKLEAVVEREISVETQTKGSVAKGFETYGIVVTPPKVRVRGPASFVKSLDSVKTDQIDVGGKKADFTASQTPVTIDNPNTAVLTAVVDVFFRIGEKRVERLFSVPVTGSTQRSTFVLYGPRTLLDKTHNDDLKVVMAPDETGIDTPQVILPNELRDSVEVRKLRISQ